VWTYLHYCNIKTWTGSHLQWRGGAKWLGNKSQGEEVMQSVGGLYTPCNPTHENNTLLSHHCHAKPWLYWCASQTLCILSLVHFLTFIPLVTGVSLKKTINWKSDKKRNIMKMAMDKYVVTLLKMGKLVSWFDSSGEFLHIGEESWISALASLTTSAKVVVKGKWNRRKDISASC
jgi:hypothetical protein